MLKNQKLFIIFLMFYISQSLDAEIPEFSSDLESYSKTSHTSMLTFDARNEARIEAERNENNRIDKFKKSSFLDKIKSLTSGKVSLKEAWTGKPDAQKVALARSKAAFKVTDFETQNKIFIEKPEESDAALFEMHMTPEEIKYQKETAAREVHMERMEAERKKAQADAKAKVEAEARAKAQAEAKLKAETEIKVKLKAETEARAKKEAKMRADQENLKRILEESREKKRQQELKEQEEREVKFQKYLKENESLFKRLVIKNFKEEINENLRTIGFTPEYIDSRGDQIPTESEISKVYRKKLLQVHPDKGGSKEDTQKVINAKDFLIDNLPNKINVIVNQIARNNFK